MGRQRERPLNRVSAGAGSMPAIRILLADPSQTYRDALVRLLSNEPVHIVGEARNTVELCLGTERLRPDVILLDPELPGLNGLETLPQLTEGTPQPAVILLSLVRGEIQRESERISGARFILKEQADPTLIQQILGLARVRRGE